MYKLRAGLQVRIASTEGWSMLLWPRLHVRAGLQVPPFVWMYEREEGVK